MKNKPNHPQQRIDITVPVSSETPVWPGDPVPQLTTLLSIEHGDDCHLSQLTFSLHTGTHVDAPLHFIRGGKDVSSLDISKMEGEILLVEALGIERITVEVLMSLNLTGIVRLLFKTLPDHLDRNDAARQQPYPALDISAARYLADHGFVLCAIDGMTIAIEEQLTAVHRTLLEKEIVIVENLNLHGLTAGLYEIQVVPMLIPGAEAAPARVTIKKSFQ